MEIGVTKSVQERLKTTVIEQTADALPVFCWDTHLVKIKNRRERICSVFFERRHVMKKQLNYNYAFLFYDVGEKRVQKVFKICKKYLLHFQKSVFRGEMTPAKFIQLRKELNRVIDKDEDFVCIIKLMNDNVFGEEILGNGGQETGEDLMI